MPSFYIHTYYRQYNASFVGQLRPHLQASEQQQRSLRSFSSSLPCLQLRARAHTSETNADRAVRELDRGMQAAWQIAEEAEAGRQAALERVATLEAALRVALEDDEDDPPEPTPPS